MGKKQNIFKYLYILIILVIIAVLCNCRRTGTFTETPSNVILISIDTCRADRLGCYGFKSQTTPNIDSIASEGILFEHVVSPTPLTLPSHSSMLTGTSPLYHNVHENYYYQLSESNLTLAEVLGYNGFVTGAIVSSFVLNSRFGISQGFDTYNDDFEEDTGGKYISQRKGEEASSFAVSFLEKNKENPFFLFLHYYDPHYPYQAPEPFASLFPGDPYSAEIAYTDFCIGQVIEKLKALNLFDSTALVITSDHGEGLGDHGESSHGYFIYQECIKVPLIIKAPGVAKGKRIAAVSGLIDIVPTICKLLKIQPPSQVHGVDLLNNIKKKDSAPKRYVYAESIIPTVYDCNPVLAVVGQRYKYIQSTRPELYDLLTDAQEKSNLISTQPQRGRILEDALKLIFEQQSEKSQTDNTMALDQESIDRLQTLGYVSGDGIDDSLQFDKSKFDAKDLIKLHELNAKALVLVSENKFDEARKICDQMLQKHPDFYQAYKHLGNIAFEEGNVEAGLEYYRHAISLRPDSVELYEAFATGCYRHKKYELAIKNWEKTLELNPNWPEVMRKLGDAFYRTKDYQQAIDYYHQVLQFDSDFEVYLNLGMIYIEQKQIEKAIESFIESIGLNPDQPAVLNTLGELYFNDKKLNEALKYYRLLVDLVPEELSIHNKIALIYSQQGKYEAVIKKRKEILKMNPDHLESLFNLATTLRKTNQYEESLIYFKKALEINPDFLPAHDKISAIYYQQGQIELAISHWKKIVQLQPNSVLILNNLAWIMSTDKNKTIRNPAQAVEFALQACELTENKHPDILSTLAAAYAAEGKFEQALETAKKAERLFLESKQAEKAEQIKTRINLYENQEQYFE